MVKGESYIVKRITTYISMSFIFFSRGGILCKFVVLYLFVYLFVYLFIKVWHLVLYF